jgi:hypothetical protein
MITKNSDQHRERLFLSSAKITTFPHSLGQLRRFLQLRRSGQTGNEGPQIVVLDLIARGVPIGASFRRCSRLYLSKPRKWLFAFSILHWEASVRFAEVVLNIIRTKHSPPNTFGALTFVGHLHISALRGVGVATDGAADERTKWHDRRDCGGDTHGSAE